MFHILEILKYYYCNHYEYYFLDRVLFHQGVFQKDLVKHCFRNKFECKNMTSGHLRRPTRPANFEQGVEAEESALSQKIKSPCDSHASLITIAVEVGKPKILGLRKHFCL